MVQIHCHNSWFRCNAQHVQTEMRFTGFPVYDGLAHHVCPFWAVVLDGIYDNVQRGLGSIQRQTGIVMLFKNSLFFLICIYLWLCWVFITACRFSLVAVSEGCPPGSGCGLLVVAASLVVEYGLEGTRASVVVAYELSCSRHVESSLTRYRTHISCIGRQILNHWTTREVPGTDFG